MRADFESRENIGRSGRDRVSSKQNEKVQKGNSVRKNSKSLNSPQPLENQRYLKKGQLKRSFVKNRRGTLFRLTQVSNFFFLFI